MRSIVQVALPLPLFRTFSYTVPDELLEEVRTGSTVEVDFHSRILTGWVVENGGEEVPGLKAIRAVEPLPPLPPAFLAFLRKLSILYLTPLGEMIHLAIPPLRKSFRILLSLRVFAGENRLDERFPLPSRGMNAFLFRERFRVSEDEWRRLLESGALRLEKEQWVFEETQETSCLPGVVDFSELPRGEDRKAFFLDVLGKAKGAGEKVFLLFPDFAREDAFLHFLEGVCSPSSVVRYDSRLKPRERLVAFLRVVEGDFEVVVGTRLAAFLFPCRDRVRYFLFDPEEKGYFPDRAPRYSILEVLRERVHHFGGHLHIVGAVPSLQVYFLWMQGALTMRKALSGTPQVDIRGIPAKRQWNQYALFPPTRSFIGETIRDGGIVLVWVQKTGYATALGCRECGFYYTCPSCGLALRYHRDSPLLICPLCHFEQAPEDTCPSCGGIAWEGWGQGIERVFEEVTRVFPGVWKERVDPENDEEGWAGRIQTPAILVGTSAVLREDVLERTRLFVIHSLDEWLSLPEGGAQETLYVRLQKVLRLLPRGAQVIVQGSHRGLSQLPEFLKSWSSFYPPVLEKRKILGYPPYARLVRIVAWGRNKAVALQVLSRLRELFVSSGVQVLGPFSSVRPRRARVRSAELLIRYAEADVDKVFALCAQVFPLSGVHWSFEFVLL